MLQHTVFAQNSIVSEIAIIPKPVSLIKTEGYFILPQTIQIEAKDQLNVEQSVKFLKERLSATSSNVNVVSLSQSSTIKLTLSENFDKQIGNEGYRLEVNKSQIVIIANKPAGIFYGVQTLLQLFPKEIESKKEVENVKWQIPCVNILDYPLLGWRGLMLDVTRHFFTKEDVKQYIDAMVRYKFNVLHLHLADDEGWRVEIKGYPKLTEIGAWNVKREGNFGSFIPPKPSEPRNYGGFYTHQDIKELVAYAQQRFVNILPEIDVPGHSLAAIASYPELSCTSDAVNYKVRSGEQIMDWSKGAPPIALLDNTLCPANEKVYQFLDTVIEQVAKLFPFSYIHMGGDEAPHNYWQNNPQIAKLMKRENLKSMPEVQGYFERRVEKLVAKHGKQLIAWDEVLDGGISKSTTIMSWQNIQRGIDASNRQHQVVMSPKQFTYIDYMQADSIMEPHVYASLRLSKAYEFNPIPSNADAKFIIGGQANLWTEQVYNIRQAEYMTWPRGFAIAEAVWSPTNTKNWKNFFARTEQHFERLAIAQTNYAPSVYDPAFEVKRDNENNLIVSFETELDGLDIYYSFDGSWPDSFAKKYTMPLTVPIDAVTLRVITYRGNEKIGRMVHMPVQTLQKRAKPIKKPL